MGASYDVRKRPLQNSTLSPPPEVDEVGGICAPAALPTEGLGEPSRSGYGGEQKSPYRRRELNTNVQLCINERHGKGHTLKTCTAYSVMLINNTMTNFLQVPLLHFA